MAFVLIVSQRHWITKLKVLMEQETVKRVKRASQDALCPHLGKQPTEVTRSDITSKGGELATPFLTAAIRRTPDHYQALYKERNYIEPLINRLKQFRRIATRYNEQAVNFLALICKHALALENLAYQISLSPMAPTA